MIKIPRVAVMLSSYNGEKYIEEQINSILSQSGVEVFLYIRDDGSSDSTPLIVEKYKEMSNIILDLGKNVGFQRSFMQIIKDVPSTYDYYAFSDQDDYWEKNKLAEAVSLIKKEDSDLYASALNVVDEHLTHLYYNNFANLKISFGSAISRQRLAGCTMVFTPSLLEIAKSFPIERTYEYFSHDAVVYLLALAVGYKVSFDNNSYIKFRRHTGTVTEHGKGFFKRLQSIISIFYKEKGKRYNQVKELKNNYGLLMTTDVSSSCNRILVYKDSFIKTLKLMFFSGVRCGVFVIDFVNAVGILLRCY